MSGPLTISHTLQIIIVTAPVYVYEFYEILLMK